MNEDLFVTCKRLAEAHRIAGTEPLGKFCIIKCLISDPAPDYLLEIPRSPIWVDREELDFVLDDIGDFGPISSEFWTQW